MKYIILILFALTIVSCKPQSKSECASREGKAVLVKYKVAKSSHLWFEDPDTKEIYDISGLGGRRKPTINLGDTIDVKYCKCVEPIIINEQNYIRYAGGEYSRTKALPGY